MFRRLAVLLAGMCAAVFVVAGVAIANTGSVIYAPEQAGYAATGGHFKEGEFNVTLPDASKFAATVGRLSFSVQLWAPGEVVDLSVSACTDSTCTPGGVPSSQKYSLAVNVFNPTTHALICSTTNKTCTGVPASWNNARLSPGQTAGLALFYDPTSGFVLASVNNYAYNTYYPGPGLLFDQARLGAEFGTTPWSTVTFKPPGTQQLLASIGVPSNMAEIVAYNGYAACFSSWWTSHQVKMTSGGTSAPPVEVTPQGLSGGGCDFSLYLEP